jgi:hypothetical protein
MKQQINIALFKRIVFYVLAVIMSGLTSCTEKKPAETTNKLKIMFNHRVDNNSLIFNQMIYTNAAGNNYEVTEVMYFISDLKLHHSDGRTIQPAQWDDIHYIDTNIPTTFEWIVGNDIPTGLYDSLTFTFGFTQARNQSFMFVNPPEVNMAWPEVLGGGFHYLMLNGWWKDLQEVRRPFNFHLGIGQIYANNSGQVSDITGFIHNNFTVRPSGERFSIEENKDNIINMIMHIESWFETPVIYDHNTFGGAIMQKQEAMHLAALNGRNAFSIE